MFKNGNAETKMQRQDFTAGTVYQVRGGIGNGDALQTYLVDKTAYFNAEYGDGGQWLIHARRFVKKSKKFSGQAYVQGVDRLVEAGAVIVANPLEAVS